MSFPGLENTPIKGSDSVAGSALTRRFKRSPQDSPGSEVSGQDIDMSSLSFVQQVESKTNKLPFNQVMVGEPRGGWGRSISGAELLKQSLIGDREKRILRIGFADEHRWPVR